MHLPNLIASLPLGLLTVNEVEALGLTQLVDLATHLRAAQHILCVPLCQTRLKQANLRMTSVMELVAYTCRPRCFILEVSGQQRYSVGGALVSTQLS